MGAFTPKYPISDEAMLDLLNKYPFLKFRKAYGSREPAYETDAEDIENNYYKYWDGTGWEDLWKNRYLPRLFKLYDSWDDETKARFEFMDVKEKYGELRVYTSVSTGEDSLNGIAESLSSWICYDCGKEPRTADGKRVIWTTGGWITNLCEDCARKALGHGVRTSEEDDLDNMRTVKEKPFGYTRFSREGDIKVIYKETEDGWLERDHAETVPKEVFKQQFMQGMKGE